MSRVTRTFGPTFLAIALALVVACRPAALTLGVEWKQVEFEPSKLLDVHRVIDCERSGLRLDGIPVSKSTLLDEIRKDVPLDPRPMVFVRFARKDYGVARSLAKDILETGMCREGGCMFQVVGD